MEKVLTVVVPSYNAENYLQEDIPYFLDEEILDDVEILIINDGSQDRTQKVGENYQDQYPDSVRVINKENGGHGSAVNVGIREAKGKYLKIVDADDWVHTASFKKLVKELKTESNDLILHPFHYVNDGTGAREDGLPMKQEQWEMIEYGRSYELEEVLGQIKDDFLMHEITYRTALLREHPIQLDENHFYVDQEYVLYPVPFIKTVVFYPEYVYQYRIATLGQSMNWNNMIKNRDMHGEVLLNIIKYYDTLKASLTDERKDFFVYRCAKMLNTQASIYLMMEECGQAKKEMRQFEKKIQNKYPEVYRYPYSRKMQLLRHLRYMGFRVVSAYAKRVNVT